jgi:hypothetical protein
LKDVLTWSPQGRLHQIECASKLKSILFTFSLSDALEAVKQGGAVVGCKVSQLKACVNEEI